MTRNKIQIKLSKCFSLLTCFSMFSMILCSCGKTNTPSTDISTSIEDISSSTEEVSESEESHYETEVNFTIVEQETPVVTEMNEAVESGEVDDIYSMVCSNIEYKLSEAGLTSNAGVAYSVENDDYAALGLYYYDDEIEFFSNDLIKSVGFVEVLSATENNSTEMNTDSLIVVDPANNETLDYDMVYAYNYQNIGSDHFIYNNKYVKYYQQSADKVIYTEFDNDIQNYDLSIGDLYDYDKKQYVYDESIFGEYKTHSAVKLFNDEDYKKLEEYLQQMSKNQEKEGYKVNEYNIVYISPESIQAYLDSEEEDTFFGYKVSDLSNAFGQGTTLELTDTGFREAKILGYTNDEYDWKSLLKKCGITSGILIVGAILSPIGGGASFGCALFTIVKETATLTALTGLSSLAMSTVRGLINGDSLTEAIKACSLSELDTLADGLVLISGMTSIGVVTGSITPAACFAAGTPVSICNSEGTIDYVPIEQIEIGDYILSYNENDKTVSNQIVTSVFSKRTEQLTLINIGDTTIVTTPEHPFYNPVTMQWIKASYLRSGDTVLSSNNDIKIISFVNTSTLSEPITVYNLTVNNNHTYFVGYESILVHNDCTNITSLRNKAVREKWKEERSAVINGTSSYSWTKAQKRELIKTGKVKGFEGHHIISVSELVGTAQESLISDPKNIALLSSKNHIYVHKAGDSITSNRDNLLKVAPFVEKALNELPIAS